MTTVTIANELSAQATSAPTPKAVQQTSAPVTMNVKTTALIMGDVRHILDTINTLPFSERVAFIKVAQAQFESAAHDINRIQRLRNEVSAATLPAEVRADLLVCLDHHTYMDNVVYEAVKATLKPALGEEDRMIAWGVVAAQAVRLSVSLGLQTENRPWWKRIFN